MQLVALLILLTLVAGLEYPISFANVRAVNARRQPEELARLMAVPGYRSGSGYQFISLDGWTFGKGCQGACEVWASAEKYFGKLTRFGGSTSQIQSYLRQLYNKEKSQILVTAFSSYEFPCSQRIDAKQAAEKLALFVKANNLDGAVLEFEDVAALIKEDISNSTTSDWIGSFLSSLRAHLPTETIVLQVYATFLQPSLALSQAIGQIISSVNFFVIKYYDVPGADYNTAATLFTESSVYKGTSVQELMAIGVRGNMLVVGKPCSPEDSLNPQSFMDASSLSEAMKNAYSQVGWYGGYACNNLNNDLSGAYLSTVLSGLTHLCDDSALCV